MVFFMHYPTFYFIKNYFSLFLSFYDRGCIFFPKIRIFMMRP